MKRIFKVFKASAVCCGLAAASSASALTFDAGDVDCFGEDQSFCDAGAFPTIPGFFGSPGFDNRKVGDPAGTDFFDTLGVVSLLFSVDLGGITADTASVEVRVGGIDIFIEPSAGGDANVGAVFEFNDAQIGTFHEPVVIGDDINQRKITTVTFDVDIASILAGTNTLTIAPESDFNLLGFESYAIDYARLTVNPVVNTPQIPLPAPLVLLAGGLGMLGLTARRRKVSQAAKT